MLWIAVGVVLVLLVFGFIAFKNRGDTANTDVSNPNLPYLKLPTLFTPAERSFCGVLDLVVGTSFRVFGKVRVADVITVQSGLTKSERAKAFNAIKAKHFDFILCDPKDLSVLCAIELNDSSHQRKERQARDVLIGNVCEAAKIPLVTFDAQYSYSPTEVANQLAQHLSANGQREFG